MDLVTQGYIAWQAFRGATAQDRRGCCGNLVRRQRAVNVSPHFPPTSPDYKSPLNSMRLSWAALVHSAGTTILRARSHSIAASWKIRSRYLWS